MGRKVSLGPLRNYSKPELPQAEKSTGDYDPFSSSCGDGVGVYPVNLGEDPFKPRNLANNSFILQNGQHTVDIIRQALENAPSQLSQLEESNPLEKDEKIEGNSHHTFITDRQKSRPININKSKSGVKDLSIKAESV